MSRKHIVFVYGTLRRNERNHHLLDEATIIAEQAWTTGSLFDTGNGYPAMLQNKEGRVYGELYKINDKQMGDLDHLEGYFGKGQDNLYERITQKIFTDQGEYEANVYVMDIVEKNNIKIRRGDWKVYRSITNAETIPYFAYGSCMDDARFKEKSVNHFFQIKMGRGLLDGYSLRFTRKVHDGGRADVVEEGGVVEGIVYKISKDAIPYLYSREGVNSDCYRPAIVQIKMENDIFIDALTFIVVNKEEEVAPPAHYLEEIIRGGTGVLSSEYMKKLIERFPSIVQ
ncbi:gamma-glutamylcyclotransferase [Cytobacillus depressus]|uniref:Gamma-glutamylcyclotransferase family protein n=1 Tax=Cytobacillus depressus TaxID=1602942 RepID=A0A6L3VAE1_9BACI|nr:gamma-glutamylcyclotransferase family protein [Cytobacillus depressus]KAB2338039.1 gamma-glutamylcyclotransferase [Cytobacillus depressus]